MHLCILTDDDGMVYHANISKVQVEQILKYANQLQESEF